MRRFIAYRLSIFLLIVLAACNRKSVNLEYTNAKGEVQPLTNFSFRFDQPLIADSLLNRWDSTPYIKFEPKIAGRFRWESPYELVFSPARPLPPATTFTVNLSEEILQYSKYGKINKADNLSFYTPGLKLENTNAAWKSDENQPGGAWPQVDLYFNYAVNPADLEKNMKLEADGKPLAYTLISLSDNSRISLRLNNVKPEDRDIQARISIASGLVPKGGVNGTRESLDATLFIPSPYNLTINDVRADHDGISGTVYVRTSQPVITDKLASFLSFNPGIRFEVEATEDGFMVCSENFDVSKSYLVTIARGLRGKIGGVLREQYNNNIAFGELEPSISFTNARGVYLSGKGNRNLEVRITSIDKVKVIISKIYENNLLAAQRTGYYPADSRTGDEEEGAYYDEDNRGDFSPGDVIFEKEIDTRSLPKYGNSRLFSFNPDDRLPDFKGIYHIKIRSVKDYWVSDSRFISMSDLGMMAREGSDKILVFLNSIRSAEALNGANVLAYGSNNQLLGSGVSNAEGVAEISYIRKEYSGFRPAMIIAKTADDFNYLPFNSTLVNTSRFEVGGKHSNLSGLDAFIYAERDIYRPGEKVNFSVILRDMQWKSPGEIPIVLKFLLPNGHEFKTFRKTLDAQGSSSGEVDIPGSAITGTYLLEVYTSTGVLLGNRNFSIEEFVPDRIKVNARLDKTELKPGQSATLSIAATNFFGPPAANRNYEYEVQVKQQSFRAKNYSTYQFGISNKGVSFDKVVEEGKTDSKGEASKTYSVPENYRNNGLLQAVFYTTVFDETGRPVSRSSQADIYTQEVFFGIGGDGYWYYPLNQPIRFPLIALDKSQKPLQGAKAEVMVIKHEYRTVLTKSGSYFRYDSQEEEKKIVSQDFSISGENTSYAFVPRSPGRYELRVSVPGAAGYVSRSFYSYGSWGGDNSSFEVNAEGNIDISLDKSSYLAGESVKALFKTPFSGRMLVTLETDQVFSYQYVNVENRSASIDLKLTTDHIPNVFITATLIKPHDVSEIPLTVAHGFQNVRVEESNRKLAVQINAAAASRSRTRQQVTVKATPGSFVTLAAVDNGVLQVSGFKTPDPYGYFYASRALEVTSYDMYPLLFPELRARLSSTGGDGEMEMSKRTNPMPAKRFKLVSYWSGIRQADGNGNVNFEIDIPAFSGEIRLMAVAYRNESFGSQEATMKVADPLVLSTALPRFLSPGDSVLVPVTIANTTQKSVNAKARLSVTGPLKILGESSIPVSLGANSENRVLFRLQASPAVSVAHVKVEVSGLGENFTEENEISIRPASPLQVSTGSGILQGGEILKPDLANADFMPGTSRYRLTISRNPALELGKQLRYLVQYPYGCTEQTVSAAFPQLYYGDLARQVSGNTGSNGAANYNIQEAIRKIMMRQLYNGAITLWDGEGSEHWWASVYAAHFLLEARKAGFDVSNNLLDGLLDYLNRRLQNKESILYYYNLDQQKRIAPKEVPYSLYVLALAGRANVPVMNYYKSNAAQLSLDGKYLLSAAFAIAGDKQKFRDLLPGSFSGEESVAQTGGSFYSDIRDEAIALNALLEVDPSNSQVGNMARHVAQKLSKRTWFSTQECAFSFLALGKIARSANQSTATATVMANGKTIGNFDGNTLSLENLPGSGAGIEINTKGSGSLYYFWQSEGISATGSYREEDQYLKIRRKFFDRNGKPVSGNVFSQNDLVIVQLSLEKAYSGIVDNVVITDLLPAGFEIENPRTREIPGMDWIREAATPVALDVRDDRINLFLNLNNNRQTYYYAVRAVSPGVYRMGPASAEAMYNGEYHSYNGATVITIKE